MEHRCDAVDLNLGCPQKIAKKGNYGAYLLPNPQLCEDIVAAMSRLALVLIAGHDQRVKVSWIDRIDIFGCQSLFLTETVISRYNELSHQITSISQRAASKRLSPYFACIEVFANNTRLFDCRWLSSC